MNESKVNKDNLGYYYQTTTNATKNAGRGGMDCETVVCYHLTGQFSRCKPQGVTDIPVKPGVSMEVKTGCGWLLNPFTEDKQEAIDLLESGVWKMKRAMFIGYQPIYHGPKSVAEEMLVLPQKAFLKILEDYKLMRVKKASTGLYGIAIQSYIPTATFKASAARYQNIMGALFDNGEYLDSFAARMGIDYYELP